MFKHTVKGRYITTGKIPQVLSFEFNFELEEGREDYARQIIQNGLLHNHMLENTDNYKRWQECRVSNTQEITGEAGNPALEKLLTKAASLGCMPHNYSELGDDEIREETLTEAIEKKKKRIAKAKKRAGIEGELKEIEE